MITGYNLLTYRARWLRLVQPGRALLASGDVAHPDPDFLDAINAAQTWFNDQVRLITARHETTDLVAGTATYSVPTGLLGGQIERVERLNSASEWVELERVAWDQINQGNEGQGTPTAWAQDRSSLRQVRLYPTPDAAGTDSLRFTYGSAPTWLERLYEPSVTASLTHGSATVALSGAPDTSLVAALDEFGLLPTAQSDGTAVSGVPPARWYQIAEVDASTPSLTLSEAWAGATISVQSWVSAQVPDVERLYPGKLRYLLCYYAAAETLETEDAAAADTWRLKAMQGLASWVRDDGPAAAAGLRTGYHCAPRFEDY